MLLGGVVLFLEQTDRSANLVPDDQAFLLLPKLLQRPLRVACQPDVQRAQADADRVAGPSLPRPDVIAPYDVTLKKMPAQKRREWGGKVRQQMEKDRKVRTVMQKVNLSEKLAQFSDQWKPKIVGELNGQQVKLVKFQGPFVWHHHDHEDELFLVVKGRFRMEFRDRHVWLEEGEFLIVPRGVEHRPVAEEEAHVLLFEPATTLNTGNVQNERTVAHLDRI
jgi:mannose-6-phosphate isomerase-like protein (cupin superfamily)